MNCDLILFLIIRLKSSSFVYLQSRQCCSDNLDRRNVNLALFQRVLFFARTLKLRAKFHISYFFEAILSSFLKSPLKRFIFNLIVRLNFFN